jgi:hypothetical protein
VKLIFSGKILEDSKTLESYSIAQDSFLVVVKQPPPKNPTVSLFENLHPINNIYSILTGICSSYKYTKQYCYICEVDLNKTMKICFRIKFPI